jgi:hypothetical protein
VRKLEGVLRADTLLGSNEFGHDDFEFAQIIDIYRA